MEKLCVFTLYTVNGGSSHYRAYIYKDILEKHFQVFWFPFWNDKYVIKYRHNKRKYFINILIDYIWCICCRVYQFYNIALKCDVVLFQKDIIPRINCKFLLRLLKKNNIRVVFDVDDAIYIDKSDYSDVIASFSETVLCGNDTLLNHYKQYCSNCVMLPTVENVEPYRNYWKDTFNNKIIGWIGSLSTVDNLELVISAINSFISNHPEVEFHIISNSDNGLVNCIKNAKLIKWNLDSYLSDMSRFTIGIMPLKDSTHNRGKCGFKLVQYLNMHKPVIASDIGVNKDIIFGCGFLANNVDEWVLAMETLMYDRKQYDYFCNGIDNYFLKNFSYEKNSEYLINLLTSNRCKS